MNFDICFSCFPTWRLGAGHPTTSTVAARVGPVAEGRAGAVSGRAGEEREEARLIPRAMEKRGGKSTADLRRADGTPETTKAAPSPERPSLSLSGAPRGRRGSLS
jgi:hypothetical protein